MAAPALRRAAASPFDCASAATSSKRCGWRGPRFLQQPWPDLGLEEDAEGRAEMREEAAHGESLVVGQPRALHAVAEELLARGAPRGRHMGDEDAVAGVAHAQCVDDGRRGS